MKNKGFSFIELLVAVAILGIISLPLIASFTVAARMEARAATTNAAREAVEDVFLLLTELERSDAYQNGQTLDAYLVELQSKQVIRSLVFPEADSDDPIRFRYGDFSMELSVKDCQTFCRIDLLLQGATDGKELHMLRKGVLPYAANP